MILLPSHVQIDWSLWRVGVGEEPQDEAGDGRRGDESTGRLFEVQTYALPLSFYFVFVCCNSDLLFR
jgi:hypothetical protein